MALTKVEAEQLQPAQTSITSVGTLTSLNISGALTSGAITATSNGNDQIHLKGTDTNATAILMDYNGTGSTDRVRIYNNAGGFEFLTENGNQKLSIAKTTGNAVFAGTISSGDITISNATPLLVLSDTGNGGGGGAEAKILFANTDGNAMGIGYTGDSTGNSNLIISTNAAGTHGGYLGLDANGIVDAQADILLEPKTDVRVVGANLKLDDSQKIILGDGSDLQITYAPTTSSITHTTNGSLFIQNTADDYDVVIRTDNGSGGTADYVRADGSTGQVKLYHYGVQKLNTTTNGININGGIVGATTNLNDGFLYTITDNLSDQAMSGIMVDYNVSGADALSADRGHIAFQIDTDSSATGGDTANEHRVYSIHANTKATGDSDLVFGIHSTAEAQHSSGQVSAIYAVDARAVADPDGTGTISSVLSLHGLTTLTGAANTTLTNAYGVYGKTLVGAGQDANVTNVTGTYGEVEIDTSGAGTTITNAYVFQGQFDNDSGTDVTITNGYLFYGNYAGTTPTNAWGLYIADTGPRNYLGGHLHVGSTDTTLYNNTSGGGIMLGGSGTNRLDVARAGDVVATFNRSDSDGQVIQVYRSGTQVGSVSAEGGDSMIVSGGSAATSGGGLLYHGTNGKVLPARNTASIDATIDLGQSSRRFKDMYLSGGVYLGGTGSSNYLDDYEEGIVAITLTPGTSGTLGIGGHNYYAYTKIGRMVSIQGQFSVSSTGTSNPQGNVHVNLPFVVQNFSDVAERGCGACIMQGVNYSGDYVVATAPTQGVSYFTFNTGASNSSFGTIDASLFGNGDDVRFSLVYYTS